jgi:predicted nucleotidyltransferase
MEKIKTLFFEDTLKRWHFEGIVKASGMSRERVNHYLKKLLKEGFITRIKPKGKMPYYAANRESEKFRSEKRFYGLDMLQESGLFEHINSIKGVKTAILFGSFSRGDFSKSSDIDLFIYGDSSQFDKAKFELKTKREVQLFDYDSITDIKRELDPKLIPNILKGFNIKGNLEPFRVELNA